jgi:hypothetical protein
MANVMRQGEMRDSVTGSLAMTVAPVGTPKMRLGELRDDNGALVCTTTVAGCSMKQGEMRNAAGAKLIALSPGSGGAKWRGDDYRDSNGALLYVAPPGTTPKMQRGYVRDASGALVATVT